MNRKLLESFEIDKKSIDKIQDDADKTQDALTEDVLTEEGSDIGRNGITYMNYDAVVSFLIGAYPFRKDWPVERSESRTAYDSFMNVLLPAQKKVEAEEQALNDFISTLTNGSDASFSMNPNGVPASNIEYNVIRGNYGVLSRKGISEGAVDKLRQHVRKISQKQIDRDSALDELDKTRKLLAVRKAGLGGSKPVLAPFQTLDIYYISPKYRKGLKNAGWEHLNGDIYTKQHGYTDELDGENRAEEGTNNGSIPGRRGNNPATWTIFKSPESEAAFFEDDKKGLENNDTDSYQFTVIQDINREVLYSDDLEEVAEFISNTLRDGDSALVKNPDSGLVIRIDQDTIDDMYGGYYEPESIQDYIEEQIEILTEDVLECYLSKKSLIEELGSKDISDVEDDLSGLMNKEDEFGFDEYGTRKVTEFNDEIEQGLEKVDEGFSYNNGLVESYNSKELSSKDKILLKYMLKEGYSEKTINSFLRKRGKR